MREDRGCPRQVGVSGDGAGWLPAYKQDGSQPRPWASESALDALRNVASVFSSPRPKLWCPVSLRSGASGNAQVFRVRTGQSMHVVGASPLAAELRRLLTAGAEPGWELHPVPGGRTPLDALAAPLRRLSGNGRFYNLLDRSGFAYVEEVAATPEECLTDLPNGGPRFVALVRQAIGELAAVGRTPGLAPEVASAWNHSRQLDLRPLAGSLLPDTGMAGLAAELIAEVDQRRQLILTSRTFAPPPRRTYDSLAGELGITGERVRQLEADSLARLTRAAAQDRYAPLRWRAAPAARPGADTRRPAEDAPAWMEGLLRWLPGGQAQRNPCDPDCESPEESPQT